VAKNITAASGTFFANRYRLIDSIGRGGMSIVHRAEDRLTGSLVALKQVILSDEGESGGQSHLLALTREFRVLASLRHPYIIPVYDYGFENGAPYLAMQLLENAQPITEAGRDCSPEEQAVLLIQVLEALTYLHRRRIVHHDLKPSNVMVAGDMDARKVKVLDFGLSSEEQHAAAPAGTLLYMAPETLRSGRVTFQSDLYSVGVMAYEMIAGRVPFSIRNLHGLLTEPPDPAPINGHPFEWVIQRLLLKAPEDRYASARAVIADLQAAVGLPPTAQDRDVRESYLQSAAFVGRQSELRQIIDVITAVKAGEQTAGYLISGESGVGKSRLVDEAAVYALTAGYTVIRGEAREGGGLPFQVWRSVLRRLALSVPMSDEEAELLAVLVPDIGALTAREIAPVGMPQDAAAQQQLIRTMIDVMRRVNAPVLIILEDLHWSYESLGVLQQLIEQPTPNLLIIGTYRSDERRGLATMLQPMTVIALDRLNDEALTQLVNSMIGESAKPQVYDLVKRETGGNTFFIVEVVRALADSAGELDRIGISTLPERVFTGGMRHLLRNRIDNLDAKWLETLRLAAVTGKQIDMTLLHSLVPAVSVDDWLFACEDAAILTAQGSAWTFVHDQMREAVLDGIGEREIAVYHERVAREIETVYPNDEAYDEVLLNHWVSAKHTDKMAEYLDKVIIRMLDITAQYTRAAELLEQVAPMLRVTPQQTMHIARLRSRVLWRLADYHESMRVAEAGLEAALKLGDDGAICDFYNMVGNSQLDLGLYEVGEINYTYSLQYAVRLGDPRRIATVANNLSNVEVHVGRVDAAIEYLKTSLAIDVWMGAKRGIAMSLNNLGQCYKIIDKFAVSHAMHRRSVELYRSIGDQRGIASNGNHVGILYEAEGKYEQSEATFAESLRIYRNIGGQLGIYRVLANCGHLYISTGRYDQAGQPLAQTLEYAYTHHQYAGMDRALLGFARLFVAQGDIERALDVLRYCLRRSATHPESSHHVPPLMDDLRRLDVTLPPLTMHDSPQRAALIEGLIQAFRVT